MKRNKHLVTAIGVGFVFVMIFLAVTYDFIRAQECQIIRLKGTAYPNTTINIEPKTIQIPKGGCVVWVNWIRDPEVQIAFEEGKKCEDMTDASTGFKMDARNCYVTSFVPLGGTSSLRFNEVGTFSYEITAGGGSKEKGEIIVK